MRSCDGHGAASHGNDQGNWPNPKASLFTDPRSLPGRITEVNTASPVLAFLSLSDSLSEKVGLRPPRGSKSTRAGPFVRPTRSWVFESLGV